MSRIFLSHSSIDELEAVALKEWLLSEGWDDVFLDIDPERGLAAGERWQEALRRAADRCEAVVFIVTPAWAKSKWCLAEFLLAKSLNKLIFGAILKPVEIGELPTELTAEWQLCHLVGDGPKTSIAFTHKGQAQQIEFLDDGLTRLRIGLQNAGLDARHFPWPPPDDPGRPPYRGLATLEERDAAIFFGRDAQIVRGLDALRGMRATGVESLFIILGPSGTGKSSFLRAGLLPRLRRDDRHFLPLGVIRPEDHPITGERGLAAAIHQARIRLGLRDRTLGSIRSDLEQGDVNQGVERLEELLADLRRAAVDRLVASAQDTVPPTLILSVDQAEELFIPAELLFEPDPDDLGPHTLHFKPDGELSRFRSMTREASRFLAMIGMLLRTSDRSALIAAFTIRSDRYEPLQTAAELEGLKSLVFDDLKPMPPQQFKEIITEPARRAAVGGSRLEIKPDLVDTLLSESAQGADALPLLSLTLERLYRDYGSDGDLRLDEYEAMGGMRSIVNHAVESVLSHDPNERQTQLVQLRDAFIPWLATIDPENDEPMRRRALLADLPVASEDLIKALVNSHLLMTDQQQGVTVVEVAHESLLRQWDQLADWLRDQREDLKAADALARAAYEWEKGGRKDEWLIGGERLSLAETLAAKPGFRKSLESCRDFLLSSRRQQGARRAEEERRRRAELERAQQLAAEQTARADAEAKRRSEAQAAAVRVRKRSLALAIAAVVMLMALGIAVWALDQSTKQFHEATSLRLVAEVKGMLSDTRIRVNERALLQLLAAQRIAAGAETEDAVLSALLQFRNLSKLIGASAEVYAVTFSPDGTRIVSGSKDKTVRVWDAKTGQPIGAALRGHEDEVLSVAFSPDGSRIVSSSKDRTLRLWDTKTFQLIGAPLRGHESAVTSAAFSRDGTRIVSGSWDKTLRLWDAKTGQPIGAPLRGHDGEVMSVAFCPDGRSMVSSSLVDPDRSRVASALRLWDANTGQPIGVPLQGHQQSVGSVAFSPDGRRIVSGSWDKTLRLWDAETGQPMGSPLRGHVNVVTSVAFSRDGTRIVSGSEDKTLRLWDAKSGQPSGVPFRGHDESIWSVAFSPDGTRIVSGSEDKTLRLWVAETGQPIGVALPGHKSYVSSVAFSPDGTRIVSGSLDTTLRLWDAKSGRPIRAPLRGHEDAVRSVAFSPDGRRIVSGSLDKTLRLWDANTGQPIGAALRGHEDEVLSVAFSPDGSRIVSSSKDRTLRLWDTKTFQLIGAPLRGHESAVTSAAFSRDGTRIVSGSWDKTLRLWDAKTGQPIGAPLEGHQSSVLSVAFSPDGRRIASGSFDQTLRLWDAKTGQHIGELLKGHKAPVMSVAFSPDGRHMVSGDGHPFVNTGFIQTLRLWDVQTGQPIGEPLDGHWGGVSSVAFSPDGTHIVSGGADDILRLWPAPKSWPDELCKKLTRNMSRKQWDERISPEIPYTCQCPGLPIAPDNPKSTAVRERCSGKPAVSMFP